MRRSLAAIGFALLLPPAAAAQNAEETAAYLLFGLEDAERQTHRGTLRVTQLAESPAEYLVAIGEERGTVKVAQISDEGCRFTAERQMDGEAAPTRFNISFERTDLRVRGTGEEAEIAFVDLQCRAVDADRGTLTAACPAGALSPPIGDVARLERAFRYFRSTFCRPTAF